MKIVCICGSTRFKEELMEANRIETMAGNIVLAPGVFGHSGDPLTAKEKMYLDLLHFRKIKMADEVLVVNPNNYIGESCLSEIQYAKSLKKPIRYTDNEGR